MALRLSVFLPTKSPMIATCGWAFVIRAAAIAAERHDAVAT
jgi:hypothetical protein